MRESKSKWPKIAGGIAVTLFILYFFPANLILSKSGPTYTFRKGDIPHELEEVDPNDCKAKNVKELMRGPMNQVDGRLIRVFKKYYLNPPSPKDEPYNLADDIEGSPEDGFSDVVLELLDQQREGFFIESRVKVDDKSTGKFRSNTLHLEKDYGWTGVIIEPDKEIYDLLKSKNRRAWLVPAMLSPNIYPQMVGYFPQLDVTDPDQIESYNYGKRMEVVVVQAIPIVTIIAAMKVRTVDYFSLAAQGREFEILGTIPFDKILFKLITVEHGHNSDSATNIKTFMETQGFIYVSSIISETAALETSIYAHPSIFD